MYDELVKDLRENHDKYFARDMQAADAIESTSKAYNMMAEAYEAEVTRQWWIPVTERLPNGEAERYLVAASLMSLGLRVSICYYADNLEEVDEYDFRGEKHSGFYGYDDEYGYYERGGVKYWMPLPTPPQAEEGE